MKIFGVVFLGLLLVACGKAPICATQASKAAIKVRYTCDRGYYVLDAKNHFCEVSRSVLQDLKDGDNYTCNWCEDFNDICFNPIRVQQIEPAPL